MSRSSTTTARPRLLARLLGRDGLERTSHPVFTARRPPPPPGERAAPPTPPRMPPPHTPDVRIHDEQLARAGMPKPPLTPSQALALARQGPDVLKRRPPEP